MLLQLHISVWRNFKIAVICNLYTSGKSFLCLVCAQNKVDSKLTAEVKAPSQATVERAAMNATAGLARNMVAPKTSYEFESTWKCFANDRQSQSRLLKVRIFVFLSSDQH